MAASGSKRDSAFASGFLAELPKNKTIHESTILHCRAVADLGSPYGYCDGDIAVTFQSGDDKWTLLIVEREGSAPGNERNILKWYHAVRSKAVITSNPANEASLTHRVMDSEKKDFKFTYDPPYDAVVLLLAFTRTPKWSESDFRKTAAFCDILATLVNGECTRRGLNFTVNVHEYPNVVEDNEYEECGRYFAHNIV